MSDFTKLHRFERVPKLNGASAKARAVWAMAHNALDRRGQMELGGAEWRSVLCRRLGVEPKERQWFHAGLRELESVGLISVLNDVFTLHGHAGADQSTRDLPPTSGQPTTNLGETSDQPTGDLHETYGGPTGDLLPTSDQPTADLPRGSPCNHSESVPRARVQNRIEESRSEESESAETSIRDRVGDFVESNQATTADEVRAHDRVVTVFSGAWKLATGVFPGLTPKRERERSRSILAWARAQCPEDPYSAIDKAAAAAAKDPGCREAGKPFAMFASSPGTYFAKAQSPAGGVPAVSPLADILRRHDAALKAASDCELRGDEAGQKRHLADAKLLREEHRRLKAAS